MQDFFIKEEELDFDQQQLIQRNMNKSVVVVGCAGSGKSIIALWKAKQLYDLGKSFNFVVFTKVLKKYFDDGIRQVKDPALQGMKKMLNDETKFFYYDEWKGNGSAPNVEFMIVDEAQDFNQNDIAKLKNAAKIIYFFGDTDQSMYHFIKQTLTMGDIARSLGFEYPELLRRNYRLPIKIAKFAEKILGKDDLESRCQKDGENLPKLISCKNYNAQLDKIAETIENLKLTNVGILFPYNTPNGRSQVNNVQYAYNYLKTKGLSIEAKFDYKDVGAKYKTTHMDLNFASDNPKLMTYHSAKGLQFETVFIPQPTLFEEDENPSTPLYVAMTRTSDRLYLLYSGMCPTFLDAIPTDLFDNPDKPLIQL